MVIIQRKEFGREAGGGNVAWKMRREKSGVGALACEFWVKETEEFAAMEAAEKKA
ncbi:MAG TPA: hypothetical protein VJY15_16505 [Candidatus Acidoferrum sp.]|nr:hypothetical protein [Candidatus Acidoferrum sp.]